MDNISIFPTGKVKKQYKKSDLDLPDRLKKERETRLELATFTLAT